MQNKRKNSDIDDFIEFVNFIVALIIMAVINLAVYGMLSFLIELFKDTDTVGLVLLPIICVIGVVQLAAVFSFLYALFLLMKKVYNLVANIKL